MPNFHYHYSPFLVKYFVMIFIKLNYFLKILYSKFVFFLFYFIDQKILFEQIKLPIPSKKKIIIFGLNQKLDTNYLKKCFRSRKFAIFAVNKFFRSKLSKTIVPNYYLIIHRPIETNLREKGFNQKLLSYVKKNKSTIFFFTKEWKKIFGKKQNIYYLKQSFLQSFDYPYAYLINKKIFPSFSNIIIAATYLSIQMNLKSIYIMGYDLMFRKDVKYKYAFKNISRKPNVNKNDIHYGFYSKAFLECNLMIDEWLHLKKMTFQKKIKIYAYKKDTYLPVFKKINSFFNSL